MKLVGLTVGTAEEQHVLGSNVGERRSQIDHDEQNDSEVAGYQLNENGRFKKIFEIKCAHQNMTLRVGLEYQESISAHDVDYLSNESAIAEKKRKCCPLDSRLK